MTQKAEEREIERAETGAMKPLVKKDQQPPEAEKGKERTFLPCPPPLVPQPHFCPDLHVKDSKVKTLILHLGLPVDFYSFKRQGMKVCYNTHRELIQHLRSSSQKNLTSRVAHQATQ